MRIKQTLLICQLTSITFLHHSHMHSFSTPMFCPVKLHSWHSMLELTFMLCTKIEAHLSIWCYRILKIGILYIASHTLDTVHIVLCSTLHLRKETEYLRESYQVHPIWGWLIGFQSVWCYNVPNIAYAPEECWEFILSQSLDTLHIIVLCSPLHLRKEPMRVCTTYTLHLSFWATMLRHLKKWLEVSPDKPMCKVDTYYFNTVTAIWRTVDLALHLLLPWGEFYQVMLKNPYLTSDRHKWQTTIFNFITVNIKDINYLYWFQIWSHKSAATFSCKKPCPQGTL